MNLADSRSAAVSYGSVGPASSRSPTTASPRPTPLHLVDQGRITPRRFLSKADRPDHPDRLIFDLDPPGDDFASVRTAALLLREMLEQERL
ncbi:hypothetical protein [Streptomyces sp. NPDC091209]|uniref:non-homologous end-joining DNA ligase LigD n=1 Tax=Streptomyces sp. NPDC091209 TaxID=3365974 RepID=UPI0037F587DC